MPRVKRKKVCKQLSDMKAAFIRQGVSNGTKT